MISETLQAAAPTAQQASWLYLQDELAGLRSLLLREAGQAGDAGTGTLNEIEARYRLSWDDNNLPIKRLVDSFGLSPFETRALLLAASVELDTSFEMLLSQCQAESGARLPTVGLALRLFCGTAAEWVQARQSFTASRPLVRWGMLRLDGRAPSLLSTPYHLDGRIVDHLLGVDQPSAELTGRADIIQPLAPERLLRSELADRLSLMIQSFLSAAEDPAGLVANLIGASGSGRRTLSAAACQQLGIGVIAADAAALVADGSLALFLREAVLQQKVAYLDCTALPEEAHAQVSLACTDAARLIFVATSERAAWMDGPPRRTVVPLQVPALLPEERKRLWAVHLAGSPEEDLDRLAQQFPFTPGDIQRVAEAARASAVARSPETGQLRIEDVWQAARAHPQHDLGSLARRVQPRYTWEDIVLPEAARQQLVELQQQVVHQTRVYETWGFDRKLPRGRGASALFSGSSGTGKTMAAEILAGALDLEMYRIDLSSVVSKYIGETEKNLARVFDEAERGGVILFFDEADALFGKRSEVKDAHDRYANIEINYLLQRMEDYQGVAILATNMRQALDEAFLRRLRFLIEFPFPDASQRAEIWRRVFPPQMPRQDIDIDFLARRFKLSGGNIRNISLGAAFLAAGEGAPVGMAHIIRATKREFDKIGKPCLESDFGPYYSLVR